MRLYAFLLAFALCLVTVSLDAQDKKKPLPDPTPRKEAILKLFVEEFVTVTPGKGKFPASFMMGTEKGGRDNERPAAQGHLQALFRHGEVRSHAGAVSRRHGQKPRQLERAAQLRRDGATWRNATICAQGDEAAA